MKFKGDLIITDPCYIIREDKKFKYDPNKTERDDDWVKCAFGDAMEELGIETYITRDTIYGDWSCTTYEEGTNKKLGDFCADAGLVSVFLLKEILAYNPDFDWHVSKPWTTTCIKDFDGDVEIKVVPFTYTGEDGKEYNEEEVRVIGKGNINFYTTQTGL